MVGTQVPHGVDGEAAQVLDVDGVDRLLAVAVNLQVAPIHAGEDHRRQELPHRVKVLKRANGVEPPHRRHLHAVFLLVEAADQFAGVLGQRIGVLVIAVEVGLGDVVDTLHPGELAGVHDVVRAYHIGLAGEAADSDQLRGAKDAGKVVDLVAALECAQQRVQIADVGVDVALGLSRHTRGVAMSAMTTSVSGSVRRRYIIRLLPMNPEPPVMHTRIRSFLLQVGRVAFGVLDAGDRAPDARLRLDVFGRARRGKLPAPRADSS